MVFVVAVVVFIVALVFVFVCFFFLFFFFFVFAVDRVVADIFCCLFFSCGFLWSHLLSVLIHPRSCMPHSGVSICKTLIPESITLGHHGVTHLNAFTVFLFSNFGHLPFFLKSPFCP